MSASPPPLPQQQNQPPPVLQYGSPYQGGSGPPCPKCSCRVAQPVSFTWWGGLIGPKLLSHVKCSYCGYCFNGKTGQPNTTGIIIYTVVGLVIGVAILIAIRMMRF